MANRTMWVGDTFPDALFQVEDETGVLDLSTASGIEVQWIGQVHTFSGAGAAIHPPTMDPDGIHEWNCRYVFASGDSAQPDEYEPFVVVTWTTGKVETFSTGDILTVKALP